MSTLTHAVAARIKDLREAAGYSQTDVAARTGISQPTFSRIESGERPLKADELVQLADLFGVRTSAITASLDYADARFASRSTTPGAENGTMVRTLHAYLEVENYLAANGIR